MNTLNITLIGYGNVGATFAQHLLMHSKQRILLNIIEPANKRNGALLDTLHFIGLTNHTIVSNDMEAFENADYVFHTAGIGKKITSSRMALATENTKLTEQIFSTVHFQKKPIIIVTTNPVDIITQKCIALIGKQANIVLGTGTLLDTLRLQYILSQQSNTNYADCKALVLGEHGETAVPIFSMCKIKDKPYSNTTNNNIDLTQEVLNAAKKVKETQSATFYAISACMYHLFCAFESTEETIVPVSVPLNDAYKKRLNINKDLCMSLPVIIANKQLIVIDDFLLTDDEITSLKKAASFIASNI